MGCCEVRIDVAGPDDVVDVEAMVRSFLATTPYGKLFGWDGAQVQRFVDAVVLGGLGVVFVARVQVTGTACGMIAAVALNEPIAGLYIAEELAWWMNEADRGGRTALRLHKTLEEWAQAKGCVLLKMVAPANRPDVEHYYSLRGYEMVESAWIKRFDGPQPIAEGEVIRA